MEADACLAVLMDGLADRDAPTAYACFLKLREESRATAAVYPYFGRFAAMLNSGSSYVRARGLLLIAANAQWDVDNKIDEIIGDYLAHVMDAKPTVSRQLIAALPELARGKPELAEDIRQALHHANPARYRGSMAPLIQKDIAAALDALKGM